MSVDSGVPTSGVAPPPVEPIRVLVPSRIGPLGVEFLRTAITRLVVGPSGAARRLYFDLSEYEESELLDEVLGRLSEYLAGARRAPDLEYELIAPELDGLARRVLKETAKIPYGKTRTYKEIAESAGRADAYRQVAAILDRNPLPLLVPCHRVVPGKQGLGGWVGGISRKRWLLRMEQEQTAQLSA
jgi:methylated-DNA-[protein]-cysteine S-methyltransferase